MCCPEGHIREKLLCEPHINQTKDPYITRKMLYCDCGKPIERTMIKHPIEDHWNLTETLLDTNIITTTFGEPQNQQQTIQKIKQVPYDQLQKYLGPPPTKPYKPIPIDCPNCGPTTTICQTCKKLIQQGINPWNPQPDHPATPYKSPNNRDPRDLNLTPENIQKLRKINRNKP